MRVLVTRPALSGERTAEKLQARGHEALLMPLTRAVHDVEVTRRAMHGSTGALAVTSAEAVRALNMLGTDLAPHLGRTLFAVGRATADEATEAGFVHVLHSDGDGARLADRVVAERSRLGHEPLTYLAGRPRAAGFEKRLAAAAVPFDVFESYAMHPVQPAEAELEGHLRISPADAVLFYSRHGAELFFHLDFVRTRSASLKNTRLLCLSATIATIVPQDLASNVEIAAVPEEEGLLQLLDVGESPILL